MAYMSEEGYKQLIEELKYLESVERPKIVSAIAEARDKGDLSENAEYDAAKEAQGLLEMKISQLKSTIGDAKIIDTSKMNADTVQILTAFYFLFLLLRSISVHSVHSIITLYFLNGFGCNRYDRR